MSDIKMFRSNKIQPCEASTFYYIRYSRQLQDEAISMILKEKDDSESRLRKTLVYLTLVGAIYGDIKNQAFYYRSYFDTNKEYAYDEDQYINADFIKNIRAIEEKRCFNDG